jgi:hypothetical protein
MLTQSVWDGSYPLPSGPAQASPIGAAAINAAATAMAANRRSVERKERCAVIGFSIQLLLEPGVSPGEGISNPEFDVFAATWRRKFGGESICYDNLLRRIESNFC